MMKSYLLISLTLLMFSIETNQVDLSRPFGSSSLQSIQLDDEFDISDLIRPSNQVPQTTEQQTFWERLTSIVNSAQNGLFDNKQTESKAPSNDWIEMKDLKVIEFSANRRTRGTNRRRQMNCLSGDLCEVGPTEATCTNYGFNGTKFTYHCVARLHTNIQFDRFNITCEIKDKHWVQKDSCVLYYTIKQVDYALIYMNYCIGLLCLITSLVLLIYACNSCKKSNQQRKIFLTQSYFTRPSHAVFH